jgi:hypothetical protein
MLAHADIGARQGGETDRERAFRAELLSGRRGRKQVRMAKSVQHNWPEYERVTQALALGKSPRLGCREHCGDPADAVLQAVCADESDQFISA